MAKRQNFVVGSTNPNTTSQTDTQLNHGWDKYNVLKSGVLNGVFNAVSDYSNDSSNEIANAIQSITGSQPTGQTQTELADALNQLRQDIETSSLTFKGYIATSAPSSSTYALVEGNLWINSATLPTSFPVAASDIKEWDGSAWQNYSSTYTASNFDFFRNVNDNEGYYWFGGQWVVMSTDMSTTYFSLNQTSGKWEIKSSVNLPGNPTTTTAPNNDNSTKIATTAWVKANMPSVSQVVPVGAIMPFAGDTAPSGYLLCDGRAVSRYTYSSLASVLEDSNNPGHYLYGDGDGSTTFNLPNLSLSIPMYESGATIGSTNTGSLPKITGNFTGIGAGAYGADGAFSVSAASSAGWGDSWGNNTFSLNFSASRSSSAYSRTDNAVIPQHTVMLYVIKY